MLNFIVNESARSGKGREVWNQIEQVLIERSLHYVCYKTEYEGHALGLAFEITERISSSQTLIVVGGDGTVNEVLNGIQHFDHLRFGVIPVGSGNDYARGLSLYTNPVEAITHMLDFGEETSIDLGCVSWDDGKERRLYAISSGIGLDALVSKKALTSNLKKFLNKIHLGKLTYILLTIQTLFTMDTAEAELTFPYGRHVSLSNMIFLAGMNFRAEGGGVPMAPHADFTDGKLDICTAYKIPKWLTFLLLPLLAIGKHEHVRGFKIVHTSKCHIHTDKPMVVHTDGEYCGTFTDVEFACLPGKLTIIR